MFHVHELGELVIMAVVSKLIQIQCNPCQNPAVFFLCVQELASIPNVVWKCKRPLLAKTLLKRIEKFYIPILNLHKATSVSVKI